MPDIWNIVIVNPMLNSLIALSTMMGNNYGLAIIVLTIVVRFILFPLTLQQTKSMKSMQSLQPKIQELQKKFARNQQKLQQEMMKLYKEAGINPLGCMWPMLVQFPIWIALYQSIILALASTPENLLTLSNHLYSWPQVTQAIPINEQFLWWQLSKPDQFFILAIIVGGTMWIQQKMVTAPPTDPKQQSMNQITTLMMPLMFGMFTLSFPSGLAIYWAVSNIIGIVMQYFMGGGWGYFTPPKIFSRPSGGTQKALPQATQESKTMQEAEKKKGFFRR
jgi:YidC/Oxa1 family membrane protein insertase